MLFLKMNNEFIMLGGFKSCIYTLGSIWYSKSPKIPIIGLKLK